MSRTDVFQSLLMLASFTIIPAMLFHVTDYSVAGMVDNGSAFLNPFNDAQGNALSWVYIASLPGWRISAWGSLRVLQRFMAIEKEEKISASRNIGVAWLFLITIFGLAIGWMARPALEQAAVLAAAADPEKVYFVVTEVFFHPLVAGRAAMRLSSGSDEHSGLSVVTGVCCSRRRPSGLAQGDQFLPAAPAHLAGTTPSCGYRSGVHGDLYVQAGFDPRPCVVCFWRNGGDLWPEHLTRPVLEAVQFLGSRIRCSRWDGRIVHLGLCFRRPQWCLEHNGRNTRVCGGRGLCGGNHAIDTRPIIGSCGPL